MLPEAAHTVIHGLVVALEAVLRNQILVEARRRQAGRYRGGVSGQKLTAEADSAGRGPGGGNGRF